MTDDELRALRIERVSLAVRLVAERDKRRTLESLKETVSQGSKVSDWPKNFKGAMAEIGIKSRTTMLGQLRTIEDRFPDIVLYYRTSGGHYRFDREHIKRVKGAMGRGAEDETTIEEQALAALDQHRHTLVR